MLLKGILKRERFRLKERLGLVEVQQCYHTSKTRLNNNQPHSTKGPPVINGKFSKDVISVLKVNLSVKSMKIPWLNNLNAS